MRTIKIGIWISLSAFVITVLSMGISQGGIKNGASIANEDCAMCHEGETEDIPAVTDAQLENSMHAGFECMDCHSDIDDIPHAGELEIVNCGGCHAEETAAYTEHGRGVRGFTDDLPTCADCHGSHEILPSSDKASAVHHDNLPKTCGVCHKDLDMAKKHEIMLKKPVEQFESSVHGMAAGAGNAKAPTCNGCHSAKNTSHRIVGAGDPLSSINHFNIPKTCGQCHAEIEQEYMAGIHGELLKRGDTHTPVCTDCHGEHGILLIDDPRSTVNPAHVAESTCTPCHEAARLNEVYGVPVGEVTSFIDSYHGLKSMAGDPSVANCSSCHGPHKILPSSDPESSIHPNNLRETCGRCHPGISTEFANVLIHHTGAQAESKWVMLVTKIYIALIVAVVGGMIGFVIIDLRKRYQDMQKKPQVDRMDRSAIWQHLALALTFTVLVVTGFALRYSEAWLFKFLFGFPGGFANRGVIHRVAGVAFMLTVVWHMFHLKSPQGRVFWKLMIPSILDMKQAFQTIFYNLGWRSDPPAIGRMGYAEKVEYWALIWGTAVMILTGVFLWFDNLALAVFSREMLDVLRVIHLYEAWLATLAIAVWHLYGTVFRPGVYPGNPAWVTGKMPAEMYEEEHPGDPIHDLPEGETEPMAAAETAAPVAGVAENGSVTETRSKLKKTS